MSDNAFNPLGLSVFARDPRVVTSRLAENGHWGRTGPARGTKTFAPPARYEASSGQWRRTKKAGQAGQAEAQRRRTKKAEAQRQQAESQRQQAQRQQAQRQQAQRRQAEQAKQAEVQRQQAQRRAEAQRQWAEQAKDQITRLLDDTRRSYNTIADFTKQKQNILNAIEIYKQSKGIVNLSHIGTEIETKIIELVTKVHDFFAAALKTVQTKDYNDETPEEFEQIYVQNKRKMYDITIFKTYDGDNMVFWYTLNMLRTEIDNIINGINTALGKAKRGPIATRHLTTQAGYHAPHQVAFNQGASQGDRRTRNNHSEVRQQSAQEPANWQTHEQSLRGSQNDHRSTGQQPSIAEQIAGLLSGQGLSFDEMIDFTKQRDRILQAWRIYDSNKDDRDLIGVDTEIGNKVVELFEKLKKFYDKLSAMIKELRSRDFESQATLESHEAKIKRRFEDVNNIWSALNDKLIRPDQRARVNVLMDRLGFLERFINSHFETIKPHVPDGKTQTPAKGNQDGAGKMVYGSFNGKGQPTNEVTKRVNNSTQVGQQKTEHEQISELLQKHNDKKTVDIQYFEQKKQNIIKAMDIYSQIEDELERSSIYYEIAEKSLELLRDLLEFCKQLSIDIIRMKGSDFISQNEFNEYKSKLNSEMKQATNIINYIDLHILTTKVYIYERKQIIKEWNACMDNIHGSILRLEKLVSDRRQRESTTGNQSSYTPKREVEYFLEYKTPNFSRYTGLKEFEKYAKRCQSVREHINTRMLETNDCADCAKASSRIDDDLVLMAPVLRTFSIELMGKLRVNAPKIVDFIKSTKRVEELRQRVDGIFTLCRDTAGSEDSKSTIVSNYNKYSDAMTILENKVIQIKADKVEDAKAVLSTFYNTNPPTLQTLDEYKKYAETCRLVKDALDTYRELERPDRDYEKYRTRLDDYRMIAIKGLINLSLQKTPEREIIRKKQFNYIEEYKKYVDEAKTFRDRVDNIMEIFYKSGSDFNVTLSKKLYKDHKEKIGSLEDHIKQRDDYIKNKEPIKRVDKWLVDREKELLDLWPKRIIKTGDEYTVKLPEINTQEYKQWKDFLFKMMQWLFVYLNRHKKKRQKNRFKRQVEYLKKIRTVSDTDETIMDNDLQEIIQDLQRFGLVFENFREIAKQVNGVLNFFPESCRENIPELTELMELCIIDDLELYDIFKETLYKLKRRAK